MDKIARDGKLFFRFRIDQMKATGFSYSISTFSEVGDVIFSFDQDKFRAFCPELSNESNTFTK